MQEREQEQERIRAEHGFRLRLILDKAYKLGEGRTAEVYLGAFHREGNERHGCHVDWHLCAVKRVQADRESQLAGLEEAFALRRLGSHPHIVNLISVLDELSLNKSHLHPDTSVDNPPRLLVVLEYLPGSLASFVKRNPQAVTLSQWLTWAQQLASVVEWLHGRGCVHGDIKKENILLTSDLTVKLCDFSSVLFSNAAVPATEVYSVGTPAFRAPELFTAVNWSPSEEQGLAHPALSFTIDVFSLGVVLYTLASGVDPSQRASSVMAMRQRQFLFFRQEEDDRMERLNEQGVTYPTILEGESVSPDFMGSPKIGESYVHIPGNLLARLLDPSPFPCGIITSAPPQRPTMNASTSSSTSSTRAVSLNVLSRSEFPSLTRCSSMNTSSTIERAIRRSNSAHHPKEEKTYRRDANLSSLRRAEKTEDSKQKFLSLPNHPSHFVREVMDSTPPSPTRSSFAMDVRPYEDGAPPMILPGGGRLPDELRDLIKSMVAPRPEDRPTASQVRAVLDRIVLTEL